MGSRPGCGDGGLLGEGGCCIARLVEPRLLYESAGCRSWGACVRVWLVGYLGDGSPLLAARCRCSGFEFVAAYSPRSVKQSVSMAKRCRDEGCFIELLSRWRRVMVVGWGGVPWELSRGLDCIGAGGVMVCIDAALHGPYMYGLAALALRLSSPSRLPQTPLVAGLVAALAAGDSIGRERRGSRLLLQGPGYVLGVGSGED